MEVIRYSFNIVLVQYQCIITPNPAIASLVWVDGVHSTYINSKETCAVYAVFVSLLFVCFYVLRSDCCLRIFLFAFDCSKSSVYDIW